MERLEKLTEDETIKILMQYLIREKWIIESHCLGQSRGCDIVAVKEKSRLLVEVKGARAGEKSPTKKRDYFDSGQIKTHFGKAIVKILGDKVLYPDSTFAIAHPNDAAIRKAIAKLTPFLKDIGITHYWVSSDGTVEKD